MGDSCEGERVFWIEGEDLHRVAEKGPDEEQGGEDRDEEVPRGGEEGFRQHQGLDRGRAEGPQSACYQGFPAGEEGDGLVRQGQGDLQSVSERSRDAGVRGWHAARCPSNVGSPTAGGSLAARAAVRCGRGTPCINARWLQRKIGPRKISTLQ